MRRLWRLRDACEAEKAIITLDRLAHQTRLALQLM